MRPVSPAVGAATQIVSTPNGEQTPPSGPHGTTDTQYVDAHHSHAPTQPTSHSLKHTFDHENSHLTEQFKTPSIRRRRASRELALPVAGAVASGVGADGVDHDDGITGAEVVVEPLCVGGADVDAAVTDVALALVGH